MFKTELEDRNTAGAGSTARRSRLTSVSKRGMSTPNWANRTMWTGDNLPILRGMNSESVDLIYLDPPFNSNRDYSAPIGSEAAGAAFKDTWTLEDVDEAWHGEVAEQNPAVYSVIHWRLARETHGNSMKSYLMYDGGEAA